MQSSQVQASAGQCSAVQCDDGVSGQCSDGQCMAGMGAIGVPGQCNAAIRCIAFQGGIVVATASALGCRGMPGMPGMQGDAEMAAAGEAAGPAMRLGKPSGLAIASRGHHAHPFP
jgi:hypothetical protein